MSSITIRNLDDKLKASLRLRAARHGLSMEQEVRNILQNTLAAETSPASGLDFAMRINQRFKGLARLQQVDAEEAVGAIKGFDAGVYERLRPHVCALPTTAPTPVRTAQPNRAACSNDRSASILTSERRETTACSAKAGAM